MVKPEVGQASTNVSIQVCLRLFREPVIFLAITEKHFHFVVWWLQQDVKRHRLSLELEFDFQNNETLSYLIHSLVL